MSRFQKIYFLQRSGQRLRQQTTVGRCPAPLEAFVPENVSLPAEFEISKKHRSIKGYLKQLLVRALALINLKWVSLKYTKNSDCIYTWGSIPIGSSLPYIVELDNPYVLTYYNIKRFRWLGPLLRKILLSKRCHAIVCISEACKMSLINELGKDLTCKIRVVYPQIPNVVLEVQAVEQVDKIPNFLFVANDFYLKGGKELLHVFGKLNTGNIQATLTCISYVPDQVKKDFEFQWCEFLLPNYSFKELSEQHYSRSDVFILPSFQDSFGLVLLEALAHGKPLIATNLYAFPEIVTESNGICIEPPIRVFDQDFLADSNWLNTKLSGYIRSHNFPLFEDELEKAVIRLLNHRIRSEMGRNSIKLYIDRFSDKVHDQAFLQVFM